MCIAAKFAAWLKAVLLQDPKIVVLQIHIDDGEKVSRTLGPVKLLVPQFASLQSRLQQVAPKLTGTQFKAEFSADSQHARVLDPWGQEFHISQQGDNGSTGQQGAFGCLELPCHLGTARAIGQFYRSMLGVRLHPMNS